MFRIYHASRSLGPKLVIFHRMVSTLYYTYMLPRVHVLVKLQIPEIVTFMFLLFIFILGYGVASQAMIDPYRVFSWAGFGKLMLEDVFLLPYWQMYGELSLDRYDRKDGKDVLKFVVILSGSLSRTCPSVAVTGPPTTIGLVLRPQMLRIAIQKRLKTSATMTM